ncbi:MAG: NAD(P)H-dependent glycerol-3-phosphate dehydrogenase [Coriobacteriales bacterium]
MTAVGVVGAGSWGTAVARLLGTKGFAVRLWARRSEVATALNTTRHNPAYLRDVELPPDVVATTDVSEAVASADAVVVATPSQAVRDAACAMASDLPRATPVISLAKGIERSTGLRMTQVLEKVLGNRGRIAALSGPNHAEEVSKDVPSATVVAAYDEAVGMMFQDLFATPFFRVYTNPDVVGVELCGASKNVIAVAAGITDGLGYGDNTKATIMTRGLAEMARLGTHLGANPLTFMGLAGVGDLIATCTSKHSRNRGLGEHVARGGTIESYAAETHMVAEGAYSCVSVDELAHSAGVEVPITHLVRAILYGGAHVSDACELLMGRAVKDELHGMGLVDD